MKQVEALDQMHISSVRAATIVAGETFTIGDAEAKSLEERGLVRIIKDVKGRTKAAAEPGNKMAAEPQNKTLPASKRTSPANKS